MIFDFSRSEVYREWPNGPSIRTEGKIKNSPKAEEKTEIAVLRAIFSKYILQNSLKNGNLQGILAFFGF